MRNVVTSHGAEEAECAVDIRHVVLKRYLTGLTDSLIQGSARITLPVDIVAAIIVLV